MSDDLKDISLLQRAFGKTTHEALCSSWEDKILQEAIHSAKLTPNGSFKTFIVVCQGCDKPLQFENKNDYQGVVGIIYECPHCGYHSGYKS